MIGINGLVLPWDEPPLDGGICYRLGSVSWPSDASAVPLIFGHDKARGVGGPIYDRGVAGCATRFVSDDRGVHVECVLFDSADGAEARRLVERGVGLSACVAHSVDVEQGALCSGGVLAEVSLTSSPAFSSCQDVVRFGRLETPATIELDMRASHEFRADLGRRRIEGVIIPWNHVAISSGVRWRFQRGSVVWPADVTRVKLLESHDVAKVVGRAVWFDDRPEGEIGSFYIGRSARGDEVLGLAAEGVLDGLSAGPRILSWTPDDRDRSVRLATKAELAEVSIVGLPAFDDARVEKVAAGGDVSGVTKLGGWMSAWRASKPEIVVTDFEGGFSVGPRYER